MNRQKGMITLTEGRSGSSWLGKILTNTGVLGNSSEWVDAKNLGVSPNAFSGQDYLDRIIAAASTENGFFSFKVFPRHLHWFQMQYGFDMLLALNAQHDVAFAKLQRKDRVKQAISFAKALQTKSWSGSQPTKGKVHYDFDLICRCFFMIDRSNRFWDGYVTLRALDCATFTYEALLPTGADFVYFAANHAGINGVQVPDSQMSIQRDSTTKEWKERFLQEAHTAEILPATTPSRPHSITLGNTLRYFRRKQRKPVPFSY